MILNPPIPMPAYVSIIIAINVLAVVLFFLCRWIKAKRRYWKDDPKPRRIPRKILREIELYEAARLHTEDTGIHPQCFGVYFRRYCTGSPGYAGPVVIILWEASPGAASIYYLKDGSWVLCNQTTW